VYVDETKGAGYVLVAVTVHDPTTVRRVLRGLILPGQRRLHMNAERDRRRRAILTAVSATRVDATIYDAGRHYRPDPAARAACLAALIGDLAEAGTRTRLVIEQDDSVVLSDRQHLYRLSREARLADLLAYQHMRAHEEPLLALPDVVAWSWVRSREWRRRLGPIVTSVRRLGS
jgi:hypothetical protein